MFPCVILLDLVDALSFARHRFAAAGWLDELPLFAAR
jgi:hypothetical protein